MRPNIEEIYNYSTMNTLIIPDSLYTLEGVEQLLAHGENVILYKSLKENLVNVEFYTHKHCIVFSCSGTETITSYDFDNIQIAKHEMLFLPKDMYLISDFQRDETNLSAYMFFFDEQIIRAFLSAKKRAHKIKKEPTKFFTMPMNNAILAYMKALKPICENRQNTKALVELKLLELLHLIDESDHEDRLITFLSTTNINNKKRNILSLMDRYFLHPFSIEDFALLSGRSVATFHREFKKKYNISPKQYLIQKRLAHAKDLLAKGELSVTEIAHEVCYKNISHFIKAYKSHYKITPKQDQ